MNKNVIIGVAGHVDHGKTTFVGCLTGVDTDRHPEEKRRGLSLDSGIAYWSRPDGSAASFIDVPGHSNYLKNTVRGLHCIDAVVLVVAADDGVMPQTREHLEILKYFNVREGMVVLSKTDRVDNETLDLAELEIIELVTGTFLQGKPVIRFSAVDNSGLVEAKHALDRTLASVSRRKPDAPFRLWVDQVRSLQGIGTVVSGSVLSGAIQIHDVVRILPDNKETRIRSMESHGHQVDGALAGQRIGVNLHRIAFSEIKRGMCLAHPNTVPSSYYFNCEIRHLPHITESVKDGQRIKLYLGTSVNNVMVKLADKGSLAPNESSFLQFRCKKPVAVLPGDRFVISPLNKNTIIAGGTVLELGHEKLRAGNKADILLRLSSLLENDVDGYLAQVMSRHPVRPLDAGHLAVRTILSADSLKKHLATGIDKDEFIQFENGGIVRKSKFEQYQNVFAEIVSEITSSQPDKECVHIQEILHRCDSFCHEEFANAVIENLCRQGVWLRINGGVRPAGTRCRLPADLAEVVDALLTFAGSNGIRPFSLEYYAKVSEEKRNMPQILKGLDYLCKNKKLIRLKNNRYLTSMAMEEIKIKVRQSVNRKGAIHLRDCKEVFDFNRKIGLHVLEYLDRIGFTYSKGEEEGRVLS
jgi:selenocysteine-specific elongation factor